MNNDSSFIKGKLENNLNEAFRKVIAKLGITQQEFIENAVKKIVLDNIDLLMNDKGSK